MTLGDQLQKWWGMHLPPWMRVVPILGLFWRWFGWTGRLKPGHPEPKGIEIDGDATLASVTDTNRLSISLGGKWRKRVVFEAAENHPQLPEPRLWGYIAYYNEGVSFLGRRWFAGWRIRPRGEDGNWGSAIYYCFQIAPYLPGGKKVKFAFFSNHGEEMKLKFVKIVDADKLQPEEGKLILV